MRRKWKLAALCTTWLIATTAQAAVTANIAGRELFPGLPTSDTHHATTFAGWTDDTASNAVGHQSILPYTPMSAADGGIWGASLHYRGEPLIRKGPAGVGVNSVQVVGGDWYWCLPEGTFYSGRVLYGTVTWPASLTSRLSNACGPGVASVSVTLALGDGSAPVGRMDGCLDDTHMTTTFPPKIWGRLVLGEPSGTLLPVKQALPTSGVLSDTQARD